MHLDFKSFLFGLTFAFIIMSLIIEINYSDKVIQQQLQMQNFIVLKGEEAVGVFRGEAFPCLDASQTNFYENVICYTENGNLILSPSIEHEGFTTIQTENESLAYPPIPDEKGL